MSTAARPWSRRRDSGATPSRRSRRRGPSGPTIFLSLAGGALILAAIVLAWSLLATLAAGAALGVGTAVGVKQTGRRWREAEALVRGTAFASLNLGGGLVRRVIRPDCLFVIYAETDHDKRLYFPKWVERLLRPLFSSGLVRFGRHWALMVAGKVTAQSFEDSPESLQELLDRARERFPDVAVIALGGRIPSIAAAHGIELEPPFLRGDRGTVCAMMGSAREQARILGKDPSTVTIAIPGGAGLIGRQLVAELAHEFAAVVALDPRYGGQRRWEGNLLYTDRPEDVARAEAVLILTTRGDQAASVVPFLMPGAVVADDTHPEVPAPLRDAMEAAGATVLKASVGDSRFRTVPRIPIFRQDDIPGCLLEAMVVVESGEEVLGSQSAFNAAAEKLGLRARLAPHMSGGLRPPPEAPALAA